MLTFPIIFWTSSLLGHDQFSSKQLWKCPADDGPSDIDGHGTHVAGSVLGDGTNSSGTIKGLAPEAQLYFQAIGAWCANNPTTPKDYRYSLNGLPSNLTELFKQGADNGSRVHTNSWGRFT